jgi:hypothetical protein
MSQAGKEFLQQIKGKKCLGQYNTVELLQPITGTKEGSIRITLANQEQLMSQVEQDFFRKSRRSNILS